MNHIEIKAPCDLHGRKAALLCQAFSHVSSPAWIDFGDRSVPASSRLGVETLGIKKGCTILVSCQCPEEEIKDMFAAISD